MKNNPNIPDPLLKAAFTDLLAPALSREKIEARLKEVHNLEPDELKVLFPTDEELFKFYNEVKSGELSTLHEDDPKAPTTKYKLTAANKRDLEELDYLEKRKKKFEAERLAASLGALVTKPVSQNKPNAPLQLAAPAEDSAAAKAFEDAGKHLPKKDRVSFTDAMKAMRQSLQVEDEEKAKKKKGK